MCNKVLQTSKRVGPLAVHNIMIKSITKDNQTIKPPNFNLSIKFSGVVGQVRPPNWPCHVPYPCTVNDLFGVQNNCTEFLICGGDGHYLYQVTLILQSENCVNFIKYGKQCKISVLRVIGYN